MNKNLILGTLLLSILILASASALAETAELKNTRIDYVQYREIVAGDAGVVYQIKLTNQGDKNKTYELIPDNDVIKAIGSYRIDPSYKITVSPKNEETVNFFLSIEKDVTARQAIPLKIIAGNTSTTIYLVARPIGKFVKTSATNAFSEAFKIIFSFIIILILLAVIIMLLRRIGKRKEKQKKEDEENSASMEDEVQTYY